MCKNKKVNLKNLLSLNNWKKEKPMNKKNVLLLMAIIPMTMLAKVNPPSPYGPTPTARQLEWHELNLYAFIHFTTNTFNDMEWGYGDADPNLFNPDKLDCEQWMKAIKAAGLKGVVLTAKHHDGFCLWPSKYTDYSVKNSQWKNGKGDLVRFVSEAAKKYGLKFGIYLSPWDRHDLRYGTPEYITYYRNQLTELLTQYGPIFEVWEDGANGGDGYYGGRKEVRKIDNKTYYDWSNTNFLIRELQPKACIFSDGGPDTRWCGNESGYVGDTNWCTIKRVNFSPGNAEKAILEAGDEEGTNWVPAEVDVSIRPGWFFHEKENSKVKTPEQLMDIYYNSVGRGANLILNIPPNRNGLLNEEDVQSLEEFGKALQKEFSNCVNKQIASATASNTRGGDATFGVQKIFDQKHETYWATDDSITTGEITFAMKEPTRVNRVMIREHIALGQRISNFKLEAQDKNGTWKEVAKSTTIGNKRLLRFPQVEATAFRLTILKSKACPIISDVEFYCTE